MLRLALLAIHRTGLYSRAVYTKRLISLSVALCVLGGSFVACAVAAVPKRPPRFWSATYCQRVLPKEHPGIGQVICVGSGGPSSCRWASGHRERLYSQLRVFAWYRHANF